MAPGAERDGEDRIVEAAYRRARLDLPAGSSGLATARQVTRVVLTGWGFTDPRWLDEAELIVTELVANAVEHVGGPSTLEIEADLGRVIVTVVDAGRLLPTTRVADAGGGRGLHIVATLSAEHGWRRRVGGKDVWVRLSPHRAPGRNGHDTTIGRPVTEVPPAAAFDAAVRSGQVRTDFRPVVDLATGDLVGHAAAPRGPSPGPLADPAALLDAAHRLDRSAELAWTCRAAVVRAAIDARMGADVPVIVDSGPPAMVSCPADLRSLMSGDGRPTVLLTVADHPRVTDPGDLLDDLCQARAGGWGINLQVGADPAGLALMPLMRPDIITVRLADLRVRQPLAASRIGEAVRRQAEYTGARIAVAGIASAEDHDAARAMGATIGHGPLFGPPTSSMSGVTVARAPHPPAPGGDGGKTPFDLIAARRPVTRIPKRLLLPASIHIEQAGLDVDEPIVVLGCFQHARNFSGETRGRFTDLATAAAFVAALGEQMPAEPAPGVHGGSLDRDDPLCREWSVIALGPHTATALAARDCGDTGPDPQRRFDCTVTHDRRLVIQAADMLLSAWSAAR